MCVMKSESNSAAFCDMDAYVPEIRRSRTMNPETESRRPEKLHTEIVFLGFAFVICDENV